MINDDHVNRPTIENLWMIIMSQNIIINMELDITKCIEYFIVFRKRKRCLPPLIVNGVTSKYVLGLTFQDYMKWNKYI